MNTTAAGPHNQIPARKGKGCLFYGCLTTVVAVLISLVVIYFVATRAVRRAVETYATSSPITLPVSTISHEQYLEVRQRIEKFRDAVANEKASEALVLSSQDFNAILQHDPQFQGMTGFVTFENGKMLIRGSVPLEPFGYKNLYLSGSAKLRFSVTTDAPEVKLDELLIGDRQLPGELMDQLRGKNLVGALTEQPGGKDFWKRIDRIEIAGDSMTLYPVARPAAEAQ